MLIIFLVLENGEIIKLTKLYFVPFFEKNIFLIFQMNNFENDFWKKTDSTGLDAWQADVLIKNHHKNKQQAIDAGFKIIYTE